MTTKNPITGDEIKTKVTTKEYGEGWDRIFGKKAYSAYEEYDKTFKQPAKTLDAAYERRAMMQGMVVNPLFDENKERVGDRIKLSDLKEFDGKDYLVTSEDIEAYNKVVAEEADWPESEERIDVIAQNGNVGYTITEIDNSNPWCTKVTIEENKD